MIAVSQKKAASVQSIVLCLVFREVQYGTGCRPFSKSELTGKDGLNRPIHRGLTSTKFGTDCGVAFDTI